MYSGWVTCTRNGRKYTGVTYSQDGRYIGSNEFSGRLLYVTNEGSTAHTESTTCTAHTESTTCTAHTESTPCTVHTDFKILHRMLKSRLKYVHNIFVFYEMYILAMTSVELDYYNRSNIVFTSLVHVTVYMGFRHFTSLR
jgi:hypothetical protein